VETTEREGRTIPGSSWHRALDHGSDLELEIGAPDLGGLLAEAGRAIAEVQLRKDGGTGPAGPRSLDLHARDREALLVDWLDELLFIAETELWVPTEFELLEVDDRHVRARARGVAVERAPSFIKAATHHELRVERRGDELVAKVILDL
jgi:SHS2 domain-containing protein